VAKGEEEEQKEVSQGLFFDLSQFDLEVHVREALGTALLLSEGNPLNAGHLLNSAIIASYKTSSSAFSKWASFFPGLGRNYFSTGKPISRSEINSLPVNSFLAASFETAKAFFRENVEIWGRDYITLALLAIGDVSLNEIAFAANLSLQSLRDEWFRFVSSDKTSGNHRPWAQWWRAQGLQVPDESGDVSPPADLEEERQSATYLLTWNPKRHPAGYLSKKVAQFEEQGELIMRWSVGDHGIKRGDRVFFMRHGDSQPGLIGAGDIASDIVKGPHWDETKPANWVSYYAEVRWEVLQELPLIPLPELVQQTGEEKLWTETGSGLPIPQKLAQKLEILWKESSLSNAQKNLSSSTSVNQAAAAVAVGGSITPQRPEFSHTVELPEVAPPQSQQPAATSSEQEQPKPTGAPEPAITAPRPPDAWMLSDRPLEDRFAEQDRFQFRDYASALATILDHEKTETPFTMAINAPWGAGKTTLANMIAEQLQQRPKDRGHAPHIICWFNAWMHDDAPNLATAFVSEVGRTADLHRTGFRRIVNPLPSALLEPSSRNWRRIILGTLILLPTILVWLWVGSHLQRVEQYKKYEASKSEPYQITTTVTKDALGKTTSSEAKTQNKFDPKLPVPTEPFVPNKVDRFLENFQSRMILLGAFFTALAGLLGLLAKVFTSTPLGGFVQSPDKAAEAGAIQSAEKQLKKLISQATWRGNRFVVFVDDIERCKLLRSIDVLDAVNQLMDHKGVVVVLLGDMSAVAAAAQLKYKDLAEIFVPSAGIALTASDRGKEAFGRLYLQKIVQFQFDLPIPPTTKIREYLKQLAATPQPEGGRNG
jgi:hypothetical protein